jgi:hypothetical protein
LVTTPLGQSWVSGQTYEGSSYGAIEKRQQPDGKISYRARIRIQGMPDISATFPTRTSAKEWAYKKKLSSSKHVIFHVTMAKTAPLVHLLITTSKNFFQKIPNPTPNKHSSSLGGNPNSASTILLTSLLP